MAKLLDKLLAEGYCDSRAAATCATIVALPGWKKKFKVTLLCVKDNYLSFYEIDLKNNVGERVAFVEIVKLENFVLKANLWTQLLAFDYEGDHYEFTNFGNHKVLKQVFAEERTQ